jgi:hypothetical protein
MIDRLTAAQLLEALGGTDPDMVVVHEGLYIGPTEPIPGAAADWDKARRDAQRVMDLGSQLQKLADNINSLNRRRRTGR